jgi:hypothetical protein
MAEFASQSRVTVRPFRHSREGDLVRIGDIDRQIVLEISPEGLDILNWLSEGKTVGEAAELYEQRYGEAPDIEDFLSALVDEGFLPPPNGRAPEAAHPGDPAGAGGGAGPFARAYARWFNLPWLSQRAAQRLVGGPVLVACGAITAIAIGMTIHDPGLLPSPSEALLFPIHFAALVWATLFFTLFGVFVHEVAHVVAARAAGMPARMAIGNQLYVIVAQTDMTGMWLVPKRQRYVAFTMGMIIDAVQAAILIAVVWAERQGYLTLPQWLSLLCSAVVLTCLIRIGWQGYLFLRTDGYYVFATLFNCKSLMTDTEDFLRNQVKRLRPSSRKVDQSIIPRREMNAIRGYSVLWLLGRVWFVVVFVFIAIPILAGYLYQAILFVVGGDSRFSSVDFATVAGLALVFNVVGSILWIRSIRRGRRERHRRDERALAREAARTARLREHAHTSGAAPAGPDAAPAGPADDSGPGPEVPAARA